MHRSVEIDADIVLSINGEDISIKAVKDTFTVTSKSVRSGFRALLAFCEHQNLLDRSNDLNTVIKRLGWTVYARIGIFRLAVLGLKEVGGSLKIMFNLARLARMIGAV
jgi:hypothetical protein